MFKSEKEIYNFTAYISSLLALLFTVGINIIAHVCLNTGCAGGQCYTNVKGSAFPP